MIASLEWERVALDSNRDYDASNALCAALDTTHGTYTVIISRNRNGAMPFHVSINTPADELVTCNQPSETGAVTWAALALSELVADHAIRN